MELAQGAQLYGIIETLLADSPIKSEINNLINFYLNAENANKEKEVIDSINALNPNNTLAIKDIIKGTCKNNGHKILRKILQQTSVQKILTSDKMKQSFENELFKLCISNKHLECIEVLLENGWKITKEIILQAVSDNNIEVVKLVANKQGNDALFLSETLPICARGHLVILKELVSNGVDINGPLIINKRYICPKEHNIINAIKDIEGKDNKISTLYDVACYYSSQIGRYLLQLYSQESFKFPPQKLIPIASRLYDWETLEYLNQMVPLETYMPIIKNCILANWNPDNEKDFSLTINLLVQLGTKFSVNQDYEMVLKAAQMESIRSLQIIMSNGANMEEFLQMNKQEQSLDTDGTHSIEEEIMEWCIRYARSQSLYNGLDTRLKASEMLTNQINKI